MISVSSDPSQDELTSYAPSNTYKKNWTQSTQPYKMTPLTESNAKTRESSQTNPKAIQQTTKDHHSILDSILPLPPYHHQKDQEIPSIPRRQSHKFIRDYPSRGTYSPKRRPHLLLTSLPTSFMKFLVMTALPPTMDSRITTHGPLDTIQLGTEQPYSLLQDTRHNWTSQNTQPLKQDTLHSTVQTVPLHAVNSGAHHTQSSLHYKTQTCRFLLF